MKLSQGDSVIVISGKDKGKKGTVMRVLRDENRVIVSGINLVTKHVKKTSENAGRKIRLEASLSASKVMIVDPKTGKPTRIGYKVDAKGRKVRIAKKSGQELARVKVEKKPEGTTQVAAAPKKEGEVKKGSKFWQKGPSVGAAEGGAKAEAGPAQSNVTHSRSAGRGS
jgi:large subunit ribosomal protein L24